MSQVSKFGILVESELSHLDCHTYESESSQSEKNESSTTLVQAFGPEHDPKAKGRDSINLSVQLQEPWMRH